VLALEFCPRVIGLGKVRENLGRSYSREVTDATSEGEARLKLLKVEEYD
jgi:hypothetical protein